MKFRENTLDKYIFNEVKKYCKLITLNMNDNWLDIGSQIGCFPELINNKVNSVICVEPEPENFMLLKNNTLNMKNVIVINKMVVGNNDKTRKFYINTKKNKGSHSEFVKRGRKKVYVECENINEIIKRYSINKIKMDIEGSEYNIIKSINQWSNIDEMIFEFHFNILKDHPDHLKYFEIINLLRKEFSELIYKEKINKHWFTTVVGRKQ